MSKKTDKNVVRERHVTLAWEEGCLCGKASEDVSKMVPQKRIELGRGGGGKLGGQTIALCAVSYPDQ